MFFAVLNFFIPWYPWYFTFNFRWYHVSQTFSFFELIFFQCWISFLPETLKCLVFFFSKGWYLFFSKLYYLFPHDSCNALGLWIRRISVYYIQRILPCNAFLFSCWENLVAYAPLYLFEAFVYYWITECFWTLCFLF